MERISLGSGTMNRKAWLPVVAAVIAICVVGVFLYCAQSSDSMTERVRDEVMQYVRSKHPETAQFMKDLSWSGGRVTPPGLAGAETYEYMAKGWIVTIKYPVVPNPECSVTVDYSVSRLPGYVGIPYRVIWKGTYQSGIITETGYVFAQ
jgi:hypothetical protein